jgi:glutaredoxin domain-containing cysteine-rich protein 1
MWRPRRTKSAVRIHDTSSSPTSLFYCSSFKDVPELCTVEDEPAQPTVPTTKKPSVFHRVRLASSLIRAWSTRPTEPLEPKPEPEPSPNVSISDQPDTQSEPSIPLPGAEKRVVVYFTSLRVVRPTFEDCKAVRSILRGFRVSIDERDLSMDSGFLTELQQILGQSQGKVTLPRVFIGGRYVGGAEEIKQLHEIGELKKLVEGLPPAEPGVCDACGGYRFVLCDECHGSHKLFVEKSGFKSCTACNENGLIRCPSCLLRLSDPSD